MSEDTATVEVEVDVKIKRTKSFLGMMWAELVAWFWDETTIEIKETNPKRLVYKRLVMLTGKKIDLGKLLDEIRPGSKGAAMVLDASGKLVKSETRTKTIPVELEAEHYLPTRNPQINLLSLAQINEVKVEQRKKDSPFRFMIVAALSVAEIWAVIGIVLAGIAFTTGLSWLYDSKSILLPILGYGFLAFVGISFVLGVFLAIFRAISD